MNDLADLVRRERLSRNWSVRDAARHGGISNTYWGGFEDYKQPLTPTIAAAVARAFDWPAEWSDEVTQSGDELTPDQKLRVRVVRTTMNGLDRRVADLEAALAEVQGRLDAKDGPSRTTGA